jgi:hypothetical protein
MYQIDLAQATDIANERIREAARWRLATEARRGEARSGVLNRIRNRLAGAVRQPLTTATLSPDTCEAG